MFIGIDLHTNCFSCCYLDTQGNKEHKKFKLEDNDLDQFYKTLSQNCYVLIEATINTFAFQALFQDKVKQVFIANTYKLKSISFTDTKTDTVDAEKLARILKMQIMSSEEQIHPVIVI